MAMGAGIIKLFLVLICLIFEVQDYVSANPVPHPPAPRPPAGQEGETYTVFGLWPMYKGTFFLVVTTIIAVGTFLLVLFFAIWTFWTEAQEFEALRLLKLAEDPERESIEMQPSPASPSSSPPPPTDMEPPPPTEEPKVQLCRSATFDNLQSLKETTPLPLPRSKSMGDFFQNEIGDNIQIQIQDSASIE